MRTLSGIFSKILYTLEQTKKLETKFNWVASKNVLWFNISRKVIYKINKEKVALESKRLENKFTKEKKKLTMI